MNPALLPESWDDAANCWIRLWLTLACPWGIVASASGTQESGIIRKSGWMLRCARGASEVQLAQLLAGLGAFPDLVEIFQQLGVATGRIIHRLALETRGERAEVVASRVVEQECAWILQIVVLDRRAQREHAGQALRESNQAVAMRDDGARILDDDADACAAP